MPHPQLSYLTLILGLQVHVASSQKLPLPALYPTTFVFLVPFASMKYSCLCNSVKVGVCVPYSHLTWMPCRGWTHGGFHLALSWFSCQSPLPNTDGRSGASGKSSLFYWVDARAASALSRYAVPPAGIGSLQSPHQASWDQAWKQVTVRSLRKGGKLQLLGNFQQRGCASLNKMGPVTGVSLGNDF